MPYRLSDSVSLLLHMLVPSRCDEQLCLLHTYHSKVCTNPDDLHFAHVQIVSRSGQSNLVHKCFLLVIFGETQNHSQSFRLQHSSVYIDLLGFTAYLVSLLVTTAALILMRTGQPALLYIVPILLSTVFTIAWRRREVKSLWIGNLVSIQRIIAADVSNPFLQSALYVAMHSSQLEPAGVHTTAEDLIVATMVDLKAWVQQQKLPLHNL